MAIGPDAKAGFVALNRFAFGARGGAYAGDLARAASDPRGLLKAELMLPGIAQMDAPTLPTTKAALQAAYAEVERVRVARQNNSAQPPMAGSADTDSAAAKDGAGTPTTPAQKEGAGASTPAPKEMSERPRQPEAPVGQKQLRADALARFQRAARAEVGFAERLVHFWSNHFCISAAK